MPAHSIYLLPSLLTLPLRLHTRSCILISFPAAHSCPCSSSCSRTCISSSYQPNFPFIQAPAARLVYPILKLALPSLFSSCNPIPLKPATKAAHQVTLLSFHPVIFVSSVDVNQNPWKNLHLHYPYLVQAMHHRYDPIAISLHSNTKFCDSSQPRASSPSLKTHTQSQLRPHLKAL